MFLCFFFLKIKQMHEPRHMCVVMSLTQWRYQTIQLSVVLLCIQHYVVDFYFFLLHFFFKYCYWVSEVRQVFCLYSWMDGFVVLFSIPAQLITFDFSMPTFFLVCIWMCAIFILLLVDRYDNNFEMNVTKIPTLCGFIEAERIFSFQFASS